MAERFKEINNALDDAIKSLIRAVEISGDAFENAKDEQTRNIYNALSQLILQAAEHVAQIKRDVGQNGGP